jgi:hypothetical protein
VGADLEPYGTTEVRLRWSGDPEGPLPRADWRALALGEPVDATFALDPASPREPAAIARAAAAEAGGRPVALRDPGILLFPSADLESRPFPRGTLRSVQCDASDPVSLALARGEPVARFPAVAGWSAEDWARRAATEGRARLRRLPDDPDARLAAARADLFLQSVRDGAPELCLSSADVAAALAVA